MKTTKRLLILSIALTFGVTGCKKDKPETIDNTVSGAYDSGVFIINEGPFGSGTGTVSFYNRSTAAVSNDIFGAANGNIPLGNIVQSMTIFNGKGYIAVNNGDKMEVVNASDFKSTSSITGLNKPRYFLGIDNNKAYITEWGATGSDGAVKVLNLSNNSISSTISTGKGSEQMVKVNNYVYVTNCGGYANDSVVTVINTNTDAVSTTINVGPNPNSIQVDANGKIWVLCGGKLNGSFSALEKTGRLVRINPSTNTVEESFSLNSTMSPGPSRLVINAAKNKLYYLYNGAVYSQEILSSGLNNSSLISRSFYGLGIDPTNDYIYGSDPGNYSSNGWIIRYNNMGSKVDSFQVGVIPGGFFFK